MSYTLAKWALWMVAAAAVGGVTGWLLRGVGRRSTEPNHAAVTESADATEVELLNAEIGALEAELAECRASAAAALGGRAEVEATDTPSHDLAAERDAWAAKVARQDQLIAELRVRLWNSEAQLADLRAERRDG